MSDPRNPQAPEYRGVSVEHPRIVEAIKNAAKRGISKEHTMKIVGMPMVVVSKHYDKAREERK